MHDKKRREISKHLHQRDGKLTQWSAEKHPLPTDPSVFLSEANTLDISWQILQLEKGKFWASQMTCRIGCAFVVANSNQNLLNTFKLVAYSLVAI